MARITSFSKQVIVFLLVTTLIFRPSFASTNLGGWSLGNPVVNGASAIVEATKNVLINGKNALKTGTAVIAPNAQEVAKVLGKGVAVVALSVAVEQLLGAVDWVLDPDNNQILYRVPVDPACTSGSCVFTVDATQGRKFANGSEACRAWAKSLVLPAGYSYSVQYAVDNAMSNSPGGCGADIYKNGVLVEHTGARVYMQTVPNTNEDQRVPYPLSTIASQVISNAEAGDSDAKVAIGSAVADIISEAESDTTKARPIVNQLESTSSTATNETATAESTTTTTTTDTTTNTTTNTTTTNNIALNFPVFCGWAPLVCESAQSVIALATTFQDFLKEDEITIKDEIPEIKDPDLSIAVSNHIQFSSQCPLDRQIPLSIGGHTLNLVISYQPLCTVAEQFRPAVILMSYLAGAFIITNTGRRAETGD